MLFFLGDIKDAPQENFHRTIRVIYAPSQMILGISRGALIFRVI